MVCLKEESSHASHFTLLLDKDLKVLVNDGDGQQNTRSRTNSTCKDTRKSDISVLTTYTTSKNLSIDTVLLFR